MIKYSLYFLLMQNLGTGDLKFMKRIFFVMVPGGNSNHSVFHLYLLKLEIYKGLSVLVNVMRYVLS